MKMTCQELLNLRHIKSYLDIQYTGIGCRWKEISNSIRYWKAMMPDMYLAEIVNTDK